MCTFSTGIHLFQRTSSPLPAMKMTSLKFIYPIVIHNSCQYGPNALLMASCRGSMLHYKRGKDFKVPPHHCYDLDIGPLLLLCLLEKQAHEGQTTQLTDCTAWPSHAVKCWHLFHISYQVLLDNLSDNYCYIDCYLKIFGKSYEDAEQQNPRECSLNICWAR